MEMRTYYIESNSFAAPFFSDNNFKYVQAQDPRTALEEYVKAYDHPAGLYSAAVWESADAKNQGGRWLHQWLCNHALKLAELTDGLGGYSHLGHGPGDFEINNIRHTVDDPKGGRIIEHVTGEAL